MSALEFKGNELFETVGGIYEYTGVIHDEEKVYGRLANTNKEEECFKFSEVLCVWDKVDTSDNSLHLPGYLYVFVAQLRRKIT